MFGLVGAQWPSRRGTPRDWLSLFTRRLCKAKRTIVGFRAKVLFVAQIGQCKMCILVLLNLHKIDVA